MTTSKRRIDACLKVCEGISTQNLEDNVPFLELARRYNVVLRERDALRAAVRHEADCVEAAKAEIKALRSELAELRSSMKFRTSLIGRTEAERDALRADLLKQQALTESALALAEAAQRRADKLQAKITEMERQAPFDADSDVFRSAFEAALKAGNWPATRQGDGYRSPSTQIAWRIAFSTVNRLKLYLTPGAQPAPSVPENKK